MIFQTDLRLPGSMQKYGCAFVALAYYRERYQNRPWTAEELGAAWLGAIAGGLISGDSNRDGDLDDAGELEIQDWAAVAHFLGLRLQYLGRFHPGAPQAIGAYVVSAWWNRITDFTHFVAGDSRPVLFDPIEGGSVTVKMGFLKPSHLPGATSGALRVFRRLA